MKKIKSKNILGFFFQGLFVFFFLLFPTFVKGACETESSALETCRIRRDYCLEHNTEESCFGVTVNSCQTEQAAYNNCTQQNQGGINNPEGDEGDLEDPECEGEDECRVGGEEGGEEGENERRENPEVQWYADCTNNIDVNTENLDYINQLADGTCCFDGGGFEPSCPCVGSDCSCVEPESGCGDGKTRSNEKCKCICNPDEKCCGIQLNTVVPFIGDCIEMNADTSRDDTTSVNSVTAFPILVQGLMKILMSAIMVFSFLMVIVAGLSMITGAFSSSGFTKGKTILKNVIISLILLGCSGLILSLINPSFFGG